MKVSLHFSRSFYFNWWHKLRIVTKEYSGTYSGNYFKNRNKKTIRRNFQIAVVPFNCWNGIWDSWIMTLKGKYIVFRLSLINQLKWDRFLGRTLRKIYSSDIKEMELNLLFYRAHGYFWDTVGFLIDFLQLRIEIGEDLLGVNCFGRNTIITPNKYSIMVQFVELDSLDLPILT